MLKRKFKPIFIFLSLSLGAHLFMMLSLHFSSHPSQPKIQTVDVAYIDADQLKKSLKNQIVEQDQQINDEIDEKAKFLSAFNQKVREETQARNTGELKNTAGGGKPQPKDQVKTPPGELPSLAKLTPSFQNNQASNKLGDGTTDLDASQSDDHLKEVKSGLQTLLSTREFVYYSYYSRIKTQIRQHWGPGVREKVKILYKQGRTIASANDRVTQVLVTLTKSGELIKVEVLSRSGVIDLDDAAIEAFEAAAPFPNPPEGMVESDGTIRIRWDFVLEA